MNKKSTWEHMHFSSYLEFNSSLMASLLLTVALNMVVYVWPLLPPPTPLYLDCKVLEPT